MTLSFTKFTLPMKLQKIGKKKFQVPSTFMILCWVTSVAAPGPMQPTGHELDMVACRRTRYRHKPTQAQEYRESDTNYVG